MKTYTGDRQGVRSPDGDKQPLSTPINTKVLPTRTIQKSLVDKVDVTGPASRKKQVHINSPKPGLKANKLSLTPPKYRTTSAQPKEQTVISVVPINRKIIKQSQIKHLSRSKKETAPAPVKAVPINRKVIKPRTSDVYVDCDRSKQEDVIRILKSEKKEPPARTPSPHPAQDVARSARPPVTPGKDKQSAPPRPMEGKWPDQNLNGASNKRQQGKDELQMVPVDGGMKYRDIGSTPEAKKSSVNEPQMVPLKGGRPYKDHKITSDQATPRKRDISSARKTAPHRHEDPDMVPIEAGLRGRTQTMKPVKGKPRQENTLVHEPSSRKEQAQRTSRVTRPEKVVGNFINDIRVEARRQDFSLMVKTSERMQVEFATHSKALTVAFHKQAMPFDMIIIRQAVPKNLERRQQQARIEKQPGLIRRVKAIVGFNRLKERKGDRRKLSLAHLIGRLCENRKRVTDWQMVPTSQSEVAPYRNNKVAVAARYKIQGEPYIWTVQLVQDVTGALPSAKSDQRLTENRVKSSLFVLLGSLGDVMHSELARVP